MLCFIPAGFLPLRSAERFILFAEGILCSHPATLNATPSSGQAKLAPAQSGHPGDGEGNCT